MLLPVVWPAQVLSFYVNSVGSIQTAAPGLECVLDRPHFGALALKPYGTQRASRLSHDVLPQFLMSAFSLLFVEA